MGGETTGAAVSCPVVMVGLELVEAPQARRRIRQHVGGVSSESSTPGHPSLSRSSSGFPMSLSVPIEVLQHILLLYPSSQATLGPYLLGNLPAVHPTVMPKQYRDSEAQTDTPSLDAPLSLGE